MASRLRVGTVPYLVARPLDLGLADEPLVELVRAVPSELVAGLRAGTLDVALSSSIELYRRPGYRYVDGLAVAGRGRVSSVQVFLRKPLAQVERVALDPASRTSAVLAEIELAQRGLSPRFEDVPAGSDPASAEADAWLAIGDPALRAALGPDAPPCFNPSEAWCARTGLPFVFALWIVRPGLDPAGLTELFARARAAGARAARTAPGLAEEAAERWGLPAEACRRYLDQECCFELERELAPSLLRLRDEAALLGRCRPDLHPEPVRPIAHVA